MDPTSSSIPMMRKPTNFMSVGPNGDNLASSAVQSHPIDRMQRCKFLMQTHLYACRRWIFNFGVCVTKLKHSCLFVHIFFAHALNHFINHPNNNSGSFHFLLRS
uniref:Uncharacterized protein n=1 Tax=Ditylum brightwellii TaxID=49249 RepID=A0A6S8SDG0_9STRA|mmetsp:Transcript_19279/g.28280  ORF Transcript_19279/g.28280 Transcript_19279/m.28280 type:complete len:104 (-) Transcript_19279:693-1004(-)